MLGNLSLEGVVVEVRPASMVDKHVQHVVGIHTQGTYTSTIAYSIFRSVPPPPPPLWLLHKNWPAGELLQLLHLSRMPTFAGVGTVDGVFAGADSSSGVGVGEETFAGATPRTFQESTQSSRPSPPKAAKTKLVSLAALATTKMFSAVVRTFWLPSSRVSRMLVSASAISSTVPSSSSTSS